MISAELQEILGTTLFGFSKGQEPTSHLCHSNHDGPLRRNCEGWSSSDRMGGKGMRRPLRQRWLDRFLRHFLGHNALLHNNGGGTFTDVTELWRDDTQWSTGCAFADYDRAGEVNLFISLC